MPKGASGVKESKCECNVIFRYSVVQIVAN
jgi:hypothetical protein